MAALRSGAPMTNTDERMGEAGAKRERERPDRASEVQTQVRLRPPARPHKACLTNWSTFLVALAIGLNSGMALQACQWRCECS